MDSAGGGHGEPPGVWPQGAQLRHLKPEQSIASGTFEERRSGAIATASENIQVVADHDFARVPASDFFQKGFFRIWDLP